MLSNREIIFLGMVIVAALVCVVSLMPGQW